MSKISTWHHKCTCTYISVLYTKILQVPGFLKHALGKTTCFANALSCLEGTFCVLYAWFTSHHIIGKAKRKSVPCVLTKVVVEELTTYLLSSKLKKCYVRTN
jgi:hypothetical protein